MQSNQSIQFNYRNQTYSIKSIQLHKSIIFNQINQEMIKIDYIQSNQLNHMNQLFSN